MCYRIASDLFFLFFFIALMNPTLCLYQTDTFPLHSAHSTLKFKLRSALISQMYITAVLLHEIRLYMDKRAKLNGVLVIVYIFLLTHLSK